MAQTAEQTVRIRIQAETAKASNEVKRLNGELKKLGTQNKRLLATADSVGQVSRSFAQLTKHVSQLALIYGAFAGLQKTVRTFSEFEKSISKLGVISGATSTELEALTKTSEELGSTTVFTASQVADGMNSMAMAGLSAEESMKSIEGALNLASIGQISVEESSLIATRAMNGFGLEAEEVGRISDVMAKAITVSATTITELGDAYRKVAPVATEFGNSLEETTAILGVMADSGRVGAEAGTQLKISMLRLSANKEVKKYLNELSEASGGLSTNMYNADGSAKTFIEQLETLAVAVKDLDDETRNLHLSRIFGSEAVASATVAIKNLDAIKERVIVLEESMGFAGKTAKEMMDNLQGDFAEFNSALEGVIIDLGKGLSPVLRQVLDEATELLQTLDKKKIEDFGEGIGDLVLIVRDMVDMAIELISTIKSVSEVITDVTGLSGKAQVELLLLGKALSILYKGLVPLGVSFGALSTALVSYRTKVVASATATALFTGKVGKLTKGIKLLFGLLVKHPIALVTTAIVGAGVAMFKWNQQVERNTKYMNNITNAMNETRYIITVTNEQLKELTQTGREAFGTYITEQIDTQKKAIEKLSERNQELIDDNEQFSEEYKRNANLIHQMSLNVADLEAKEKDLVKINAEKIKQLKEEKEAIDEKNKKAEEAKKLLQEEIDDNRDWIEEKKKSNSKRIADNENTLIKLYEDEKKLVQKLKDLDAELVKSRQEANNARLADFESLEARIADAKVAGLNDYQKYLDAQRRADVAYSKAKEALAKGDKDELKRYYDEYLALIAVGGAQAIEVEKEVQKFDRETRKFKKETITQVKLSRKSALAEYLKDENAGRELLAGYHDLEMKEIEAKNAKKKAVVVEELKNTRTQIALQIEYLENLAKIAEAMTGIKPDIGFDQAKRSIDEIDAKLQSMTDTERQVKLNALANTSQAKQDFDNLQRDEEGNPIKKGVEFDTQQAEAQGEQLEDEAEEPVTKIIRSDITDAVANLNDLVILAEEDTTAQHLHDVSVAIKDISKLQAKAGEETESKHNLDVSEALRKNVKLRKELNRPLPTLTQYIRQVVIPAKQLGGLIEPIPKFQDGGHARKTGALSGYGGGDKIKALLEAGEFIIRKEAVRALGLSRLHQINQGQLPKFQTGGFVSPNIPKFSTGGSVKSSSPDKTVNVNLNMGGQSFPVIADEEIANALASYLERSSF
jgi:TP901 family phage tail tape measure protein